MGSSANKHIGTRHRSRTIFFVSNATNYLIEYFNSTNPKWERFRANPMVPHRTIWLRSMGDSQLFQANEQSGWIWLFS